MLLWFKYLSGGQGKDDKEIINPFPENHGATWAHLCPADLSVKDEKIKPWKNSPSRLECLVFFNISYNPQYFWDKIVGGWL